MRITQTKSVEDIRRGLQHTHVFILRVGGGLWPDETRRDRLPIRAKCDFSNTHLHRVIIQHAPQQIIALSEEELHGFCRHEATDSTAERPHDAGTGLPRRCIGGGFLGIQIS